MIVSGAAPPTVDALRRVRRCTFRRVFCRFCHARSRVPIVFGPFHYCASCGRPAPDAPETIDDQRRSTGCRYRTIYGGSRGSASLPAPAKWLGASTPTAYTNDSTLTAARRPAPPLPEGLLYEPQTCCTSAPSKQLATQTDGQALLRQEHQLRHDLVDLSIMEPMAGNRFNKISVETVRVVRK